ncbi:MAG: hypothetical protein OXE53_08565 [Deltaproteobacteria bacterium]|nr:hypothetical protein [Deltaproteobacteria bacterium]
MTGPSDADWLLSAVDLDIEQWKAHITPTVSIYDANTSWEPVSSLAVLDNPESHGTGIQTFTAPNPVILQASSIYSIVVRSTATTEDDAFVLRGTYSDDDDAGGQTGWTIDTFTRLSTDHTVWDDAVGTTGASQLALKFTARGYGGESGPEPTGSIAQCGARLGSTEGYGREAELDICWERPVEVPASSDLVIEERARYFWDYPEPFSRWAEVGRGDNFTSCTGGMACIQFTDAGLFRGSARTYEMRMRVGNTVVAVSPQLKAQVPNGNARPLNASLSGAVHEEDWDGIDRVAGPFVMELFFTDPNLRAVLTEAVQGLEAADFDITNGTVMAVETWNGGTYKVRVTPSVLGMPVTIQLRASTVKGVGEGLTATGANNHTRDNAASNTVVQQTEMPSGNMRRSLQGALTATWESVPQAHKASGTFTVRLRFSEPIRNSYRVLQNRAIAVTGGAVRRVTRAKRRSDLWTITVAPSSHEAVTLVLAGGAPCSQAAAICTEDGKALAYGIARIVPGPASFSVADAEVQEATGATLDFVVSLSRALSKETSVDYATADGSATAGADYTATADTLIFKAGETVKTVAVPVLDDSHNEGAETLTLTLSGQSADTRIEDGEATGTIRNSDAMPQAWLARFGRSVADQVIDAVESRLRADRTPGVAAMLAGQRIGGSLTPAEADAAREAETGLLAPSEWLRADVHADQYRGFRSRAVMPRDFLTDSSFALTGGSAQEGFGALWGRGAISSFAGREGDLSLDGAVRTATLGADWTQGRTLAGLAIAHSRGKGEYRSPAGTGEVSSSLTGVYPYGRYEVNERLSLWGIAGHGAGRFTLTPARAGPIETDTTLTMGAVGLRGVLLTVPAGGGVELAATADGMAVRTSTDSARASSGNLVAADADVTRLRLGLEGTWHAPAAGAGGLVPRFEIGMRHDGGDAETGFGTDVGGGLAWEEPSWGLSAEIRGRALLSHADGDFRERGFAGSLAWDPAPGSEIGPSASLRQTIGAAASGGADALLGRTHMAGLAINDDGPDEPDRRRLEARLGYGIAMFGDRFVGTPEIGFGLSRTSRDYRLGWRLGLANHHRVSLLLSLEAVRREAANDDREATHAVGLRTTARW